MSSGDISEKHDIDTLRPIRTAESVFLPVSRDVFEKLYLSPKHPSVKGDLRKQVGNPTPISLIGFLIAATPNAFITMGIRGSGESGAAILPVFIFFGGMIQILGGIGEWIIGNTFSCALFFTYGTFWIVQGTGLMPLFATGLHYSSTGNALEGMQTPSYNATVGFYYIALTILTFVYTICSIRTNICLFAALFLLVITFSLFAATYFQLALGEIALAARLQMAAGAFSLALVVPVWHIFIAQMLEAVDFPIAIPVGDLSTVILGRSQKIQMRAEE
ncbi:GPR1/FUN34/yaaH family-domain-containing protein [Aspergillus transmontanensis]|uniref:GPR1/FUN34/yaaH family-domain-containing protein n=1 Tax=Aspergillus transmontanensis TaxID=1034304 RepID=A0A5N6WCG5_9EURO|nr:GPR1/FUN34/yaaH family-domain-containing protein [Aspergillus transmontanensis]